MAHVDSFLRGSKSRFSAAELGERCISIATVEESAPPLSETTQPWERTCEHSRKRRANDRAKLFFLLVGPASQAGWPGTEGPFAAAFFDPDAEVHTLDNACVVPTGSATS